MRRFGLIGKSLDHSFSPGYFAEKFFREGIEDSEYLSYPLDDLDDFDLWIEKTALEGFNVTIPYKEEIMGWLDTLQAEAGEIGAVNCVRRQEDRLIGYNTDIQGIEHSLDLMGQKFGYAVILGTGGASKAVRYVLEKRGIQLLQVGRDPVRSDVLFNDLGLADIHEADLLVNCTPLGTFPEVDGFPPVPYDAIHEGQWLFDLVYNPEQTKFLKYGGARGARTLNGLPMLIAQAEASWNIWNSNESSR